MLPIYIYVYTIKPYQDSTMMPFQFHKRMFWRFLLLYIEEKMMSYKGSIWRKVQRANTRCPYTVYKMLPVVKGFEILIFIHSDSTETLWEWWLAGTAFKCDYRGPKYWQIARFQETIDVHRRPQLQTPLRQSL